MRLWNVLDLLIAIDSFMMSVETADDDLDRWSWLERRAKRKGLQDLLSLSPEISCMKLAPATARRAPRVFECYLGWLRNSSRHTFPPSIYRQSSLISSARLEQCRRPHNTTTTYSRNSTTLYLAHSKSISPCSIGAISFTDIPPIQVLFRRLEHTAETVELAEAA